MSDHHYHYEVRNQDPVHYIDRVLLAELVVRDPVGPRSHSAPLPCLPRSTCQCPSGRAARRKGQRCAIHTV